MRDRRSKHIPDVWECIKHRSRDPGMYTLGAAEVTSGGRTSLNTVVVFKKLVTWVYEDGNLIPASHFDQISFSRQPFTAAPEPAPSTGISTMTDFTATYYPYSLYPVVLSSTHLTREEALYLQDWLAEMLAPYVPFEIGDKAISGVTEAHIEDALVAHDMVGHLTKLTRAEFISTFLKGRAKEE